MSLNEDEVEVIEKWIPKNKRWVAYYACSISLREYDFSKKGHHGETTAEHLLRTKYQVYEPNSKFRVVRYKRVVV